MIAEENEHRYLKRWEIVQQLERHLEEECQVHDCFPKEKVKAIAYITESMLRIVGKVSSSKFKVGMLVDFLVVEPTSNGALTDWNDILLHTAYGRFLVKTRPGLISEIWEEHCKILVITSRDGKALTGLSRKKRLEFAAVLNKNETATKANTPTDHWIQQSQHQPLQIEYLLDDGRPLKAASYVQHTYGVSMRFTDLITPRAMLDDRSIADLLELPHRTQTMLNPVESSHFRDSIMHTIGRSTSALSVALKDGCVKTLKAFRLHQDDSGDAKSCGQMTDTEAMGKRAAFPTTTIGTDGRSAQPQLARTLLPKARTTTDISLPDTDRELARLNRFSSKEETSRDTSQDQPRLSPSQQLAKIEEAALESANVLSYSLGPIAVMRRQTHSDYLESQHNTELGSDIKNHMKRKSDEALEQVHAAFESEQEMNNFHMSAKRLRLAGPDTYGEQRFSKMVDDMKARFETLERTSRLGTAMRRRPSQTF